MMPFTPPRPVEDKMNSKIVLPKHSLCFVELVSSSFLCHDLVFSPEISSRLPFPPLSTGGFIILRWEKFLGQKSARERIQSDLSSAHVCWSWKQSPADTSEREHVSSDAFIMGGWISVPATLSLFFLTLRYYFNKKPPQVLSKSQLWRKMWIPIKPQRIVGADGSLNSSVSPLPLHPVQRTPPPPAHPWVQDGAANQRLGDVASDNGNVYRKVKAERKQNL